MATKLVADTSSVINYLTFYYFDKGNGDIIHQKLNNFIITKIKQGEIRIIDNVIGELKDDPVYDPFVKKIAINVKGTDNLISRVISLAQRYYIKYNEKFCVNPYTNVIDPSQINIQMKKHEERDADLYLIEFCKELISNGHDPILVTDENEKDYLYKKLVKKIPTICRQENIKCISLPNSLFEFYKDQLKFNLEIV